MYIQHNVPHTGNPPRNVTVKLLTCSSAKTVHHPALATPRGTEEEEEEEEEEKEEKEEDDGKRKEHRAKQHHLGHSDGVTSQEATSRAGSLQHPRTGNEGGERQINPPQRETKLSDTFQHHCITNKGVPGLRASHALVINVLVSASSTSASPFSSKQGQLLLPLAPTPGGQKGT